MNPSSIAGIIPAVIVPMLSDFSIDFPAYRRYLEWQMGEGPVGFAVNVDTGEGPYLTFEERVQVIRATKEVTGNAVKVIAGCGGPSTAMAVANAKAAREAGADALLVFPTPAFLNDPFDPQIARDYHKAIAEASGLPIVLFQLGPIFGGVNYTDEALAAMLDLPEVIGIKDASFDPVRFCRVRDAIKAQGREITLLTGNDNFLVESYVMGAQGGLLGYGAVGVKLLVALHKAAAAKDFAAAVAMQERVQGFCDYIYGRPIGDYRARCKVALVHMGLLTPEQTYVRPPYQSLWQKEAALAAQAVERFKPV